MNRGIFLCMFLTVGQVAASEDGGISVPIRPTIDSITISTNSMNMACARWKVVGVCFWLKCGLGCSVETSVKVEHYNPDLVVSAYNETGDNPWTDVNAIVSAATLGQGGGNAGKRSPKIDYNSVRFKNVDAFGNPGIQAFSSMLSKTGFVCESAATMFKPYYISALDTWAWRYGMPDMFSPPSYIPFLREIGEGGSHWSALYPRTGFVLQPHDYKAAAVTAQRAGDIVTRKSQARVYLSVAAIPRDGWWPPDELEEGKSETGDWQNLLPTTDSECKVFPPQDDSTEVTSDPFSDYVNTYGDYVWTLWRPYQCCEEKGQTLLFSVGGKP